MKECGADAAKFQWTSDPAQMAERRHGKREEFDVLAWPADWIPLLKAKCDEVGIEFMCTVFIPEDIATIAPFVKRFKVASAESGDAAFVNSHDAFLPKVTIVSYAFGSKVPGERIRQHALHCVCSYPTPIEQANLGRLHRGSNFTGLSDHTTSVLTGALAVAAGATVIEKHVRLHDTPIGNDDFPHSLDATCDYRHTEDCCANCFRAYVANIREAEKAMGDGRNEAMPCEKVNEGRRVKA